MNELIALIDRNTEGWIDVESMLDALNYGIHFAKTVEEVQTLAGKTGCRVVILDLDLVAVQNRFFRSLRKANSDLMILVTSSHPYHPELKEAMAHHICACFRKPLETEEIEYWLRAVVTSTPKARSPTPESQG